MRRWFSSLNPPPRCRALFLDLLELDGQDLRRLSIEQRNRALAEPQCRPRSGVALNNHFVGDCEIVYQHVCKLGCEGILSKRLGSASAILESRKSEKIESRRHNFQKSLNGAALSCV
jgi:ATP-dependent DNA ligase